MSRPALLALGLLAAAAAPASAQPSRPVQLDVTGGFRAGGNGVVSEGRLFLGYCKHVAGDGRRSLFFAAGLEATAGSLQFDDPRGVDGQLSASRRTIGPSLRAGLAWSKHSWPQIYTYASAAPIVADTRTDSRMLVEAGRAMGGRVSVGVAFPGSFEAVVDNLDDDGCDGGGCSLGLLLLLAPNTLELTYEELHAGGEVVRRGGLGIGYAL